MHVYCMESIIPRNSLPKDLINTLVKKNTPEPYEIRSVPVPLVYIISEITALTKH